MVKVVSFIFVPFGDLVLTLGLAPGSLMPFTRASAGAWQEERAVKGGPEASRSDSMMVCGPRPRPMRPEAAAGAITGGPAGAVAPLARPSGSSPRG